MKHLKKMIVPVLAVLLMLGNLPLGAGTLHIVASAADEDIYNYTIANNEATITGTKQTVSGAVILPALLGGYPVTAIGNYAFNFGHDITSLVLPSGLKNIGSYAFKYCDKMTSVSIPNTVTTIGSYAFYNCSKLQAATIPDSVLNIWGSAYEACSSLHQVVLGNGLSAITMDAFAYCTSLTGITWPTGLTSIADRAFQGCSSLLTVTLPAGVTTIGESAFKDCTALQSIALPTSLGNINKNTFQGCTALLSITIPDSVTSIGQNAFTGCTHLGSVTLPGNITSIQDYTFSGCSSLTNITIPSKVAVIGYAAFENCTLLTNLTIPPSVTDISGWAFYNCSSLVNLTMNPGLKTIGRNAFYSCDMLAIVSIPNTVTLIDEDAFSFCQNLVSVTIPQSSTTFGSNYNSFGFCYNLAIYCNPGSDAEAYAITKSITHYPIVSVTLVFNAAGGTGGTTLMQTSGTKLTAPVVTKTGYTFSGWMPALPPVTPAVNKTYTAGWLPNKYTMTFNANGGTGGTSSKMTYGAALTPPVVSKPLYIFDSWSPAVPSSVPAQDMTFTAQWRPIYTYSMSGGNAMIIDVDTAVSGALVIPPALDGYTVTGIGNRAFMGCTGLTAVTIPVGVTSIGNQAFQDCTALATITVPSTLADIGGAAFANTAWMNAKPDGPVTMGSVFYRYKGTMPAGTTISIAAGTLGIAGSAFSGCDNLTGITLPESLTVIGSYAFNNCTELTSLIVPESVATIGYRAFYGYTSPPFTLGVFPDSYAHTYANDNGITHAFVARVTFDANGGTGGGAQTLFYGAPLTAPAVQKTSYVLGSWLPAVPAVVPEGNVAYVAQWVTVFSYTVKESAATVTGTNIAVSGPQAIPAELGGYPVRFIGEAALRNKTAITSVTIPDGVLGIGAGAFDGCAGLTAVTIPASVREIGTNAFRGCPNLIIYCYPDTYAIEYAEINHLPYRIYITVAFHLNGGTGTAPTALNGLNGDTVALPAQGDITRAGYHFLGWAKSAGVTTPLESYAMETRNRTLYAVWSKIPALAARAGSTTVIDAQNAAVCGLAPGLAKTAFESAFVSVAGNGRLEYSPDTGVLGTGIVVNVIDNITGLAVQTFTIVIYGDVNGDGNIDTGDAGTIVDYENFLIDWNPAADAALLKAADVNGDGNVDTADAGIIVDCENFLLTISQITGQPV